MVLDEFPDDFDFPNPKDDIVHNENESPNERPNESSFSLSVNLDFRNDLDGIRPAGKDIGRIKGLPENWDPKYIPTASDFNFVGARRLRELSEALVTAKQLDEINRILENLLETLHLVQWLPQLAPLVIEAGLAMRSSAQKIGRRDIWGEVINILFQTIHDHLQTTKEHHSYFRRVFTSLADYWVSSDQKFPEQSAMKDLANEYGMFGSGRGEWLVARAAYLNAVILDYPPEKAEYASNSLIKLARASQDLMTEMRVHLAKSRFYIKQGNHRYAFASSQQALIIATQISAEKFYSDCISNMILSALSHLKTPYVETLLTYWEKLRPQLLDNVYEKALFHSLRGKFFFDRKADYFMAAQAFEEAVDAHRNQRKESTMASSIIGWGMAMTKQGHYEEAHQLFGDALKIFQTTENGEMQVWTLYCIGWNAKESGRPDVGRRYLKEALEVSQHVSNTAQLESLCKSIKEDLGT